MNDTERRLSHLLRDAVPEPPAAIDMRTMADQARAGSVPTRRPVVRRWSTPLLAAAAVTTVIAGGAAAILVDPGTDQPSAGQPTAGQSTRDTTAGGPSAADLDQARKALDHWNRATAGKVAIYPGTPQQLGDWEESVGENNKRALESGAFSATPGLDTHQPPDGQIIWADGTTRPTKVLSAAATLQTLRRSTVCDGCKPLMVTGAVRTTITVDSPSGPATVPAWRFSLRGTQVQILRSAVPAPQVTPLPHDPNSETFFHWSHSVALSADKQTLTATFTGSPEPQTEPCGADYTAHVVESANAVAMIIVEHPNSSDATDRGCRDIGAERTASVKLQSPLNGRAVLNINYATPVPVTLG